MARVHSSVFGDIEHKHGKQRPVQQVVELDKQGPVNQVVEFDKHGHVHQEVELDKQGPVHQVVERARKKDCQRSNFMDVVMNGCFLHKSLGVNIWALWVHGHLYRKHT